MSNPLDEDVEKQSNLVSKSLPSFSGSSTLFANDTNGGRGLNLTFQDITLTLAPRSSGTCKRRGAAGSAAAPRKILDGVSGEVHASRFTALLGPSGSGKTSLLSILAGRMAAAKRLGLTGSIRVGGQDVTNWSKYRRNAALVAQDDMLFSTLTVRETLTFAAALRLPREFTAEQRRERVSAVLQELGLVKCADTRIGGAKTRGVSGGERKRVAVSIDLLKSPDILFLDEPTSGLDSFQALRVTTTLKELALSGRTVVASIHQPRSSIFALFDDVVVLSEGKLMYKGPANRLVAHFAALGHEMPKDFNPADFVLDLVSIDVRSEELERATTQRIADLAGFYRAAAAAGDEAAVPSALAMADGDEDTLDSFGKTGNGPSLESLEEKHKYEATFLTQLAHLSRRAWRQKMRSPSQTTVPLGVSIFFGLLLGLVYYNTGSKLSQNAIQDKAGLCFFIALNQGFSAVFGVLGVFPTERDQVGRERAAKMYGVFPYFSSKLVMDIPSLFFPFVFVTIAYWLADLKPSALAFIKFVAVIWASYFCFSGFGTLLSAATPNQQVATGLSTPIMLIFILFGGFYANTGLIPDWLAWLQWVSPLRYSYAALIVNQFEGIQFTCEGAASQGCVPTGDAMILRLGFEHDTVGRSIAVLFGMGFAYYLWAYVVLRRSRQRIIVLRPHQA